MRVISHDTAEGFWSTAGTLLTADPVHNTVELTILDKLRKGMAYGTDQEILLTVHEDGRLIGAAVGTPPYPLRVGALPEAAFPAVIDHLRQAGVRLPGVDGPADAARSFAAQWTAGTDLGTELIRNERLYVLDELTPPTGVPGKARLADEADVPVLARFRREFTIEALSPGEQADDPDDFTERTRNALLAGAASMLWLVSEEPEEPVAFAVASRPSSGMSRIGPVYTAPRHRGRGYGSAVTAAVSRWASEHGAERVVLFTDLANPTSNSIYQKIGYRPLVDHLGMTFVSPR